MSLTFVFVWWFEGEKRVSGLFCYLFILFGNQIERENFLMPKEQLHRDFITIIYTLVYLLFQVE